MSSWLRWLLGLDEGEVPAGSEYHWEFAGLPEGNLFFVTAMIIFACIAMIIVLYRSEKTIGGFQKFVLSALRLGALAIIVLILLHPRILTEIQVERRGKAVILFDQSISMAEQDSFEGDEAARLEDASDLALADEPTRTQLAVASFQKQKLIDALSEKNEVAIYGFGETVAPISSLESATDVEPVQEGTRLGDAMIEALREHGRQPLAGVVVVSDGRNNAGEAPLDASRRVVAENGAVIHAVGVGRAQLPKNYAVQDLSAPKAVEVGYPIEIQGKVVISGIPGPARVELIRQLRGTRGTTVVDERVINPGKKYFETRLKFVDVLPRKGTYRYELRFKTKNPEETRIRDNRREIFVRASDQEYRVLLVAGNAVPEFRYLRNFTIRDNSIVVSTWQSSADRRFFQDGNVPIRRVPETLKAIDDYDVIVLIDPKPTDLSEQFQTTVREFVTEGGGGLVFVSSESYTQQVAESSSFRVLQSLIPVSLFSRPNPPGQVYSDAWRPQLTTSGADHPLCRLIDDPKQNLKLWSQLPVFYYLHGAGKLRPAARALCVRGNTIVSAIQRVGLGQSLYLGTDDLWRWREAGVGYHERFWAGIIRFLSMGKKFQGSQRVTVETDRDRYSEGERVRITVQIGGGKPLPAGRAQVKVRREVAGGRASSEKTSATPVAPGTTPDEWKVVLTPTDEASLRYTGVFEAAASGNYTVSYDRKGDTRFSVLGDSGETQNLSPNHELLQDIARESRGIYVELDQLSQLVEEIPETKVKEVLGRRAASVWDSAALMTLFCVLLAIEWTLRKLWRLN